MRTESFKLLRSLAAIGTLFAGVTLPAIAFAYVGPGAGISVLGALWGLIIGVVMALGVILFWPIKMMIRKSKAKKAEAAAAAAGNAAEDSAEAEAETNRTTT